MSQEAENTASVEQSRLASFMLGPWNVDPGTGVMVSGDEHRTLEPKLMELLVFFAAKPLQVFTRTEIEGALWADLVVGEDTVARAVSRLRKALGDSAQSSRFIETLPKRGYRLIAPVSEPYSQAQPIRQRVGWRVPLALLVAAALATSVWLRLPQHTAPNVDANADSSSQIVARADDLYMRFTRSENEAAIGLYEQVLGQHPDHTDAQAGLANALVQRVVRWPRQAGQHRQGVSSLHEALDSGLTQGPEAEAVLGRAVALAERAVRMAPEDPQALKVLAFATTAQGDIQGAEVLYRKVISLNPNAWAAHINLGEIATMRDQPAQAIEQFEMAWAAMTRAYDYEPQRVGPWQVALGVVIGERYEQLGQPVDAELWYRRVLAKAPYEPEATVKLAQLLANSGEPLEAKALCRALTDRVGDYPGCQ